MRCCERSARARPTGTRAQSPGAGEMGGVAHSPPALSDLTLPPYALTLGFGRLGGGVERSWGRGWGMPRSWWLAAQGLGRAHAWVES